MEIQQAVVHHTRGQTIPFLHRAKKQLFNFSMIIFLNRNDKEWPHTRQIKIGSRSQHRGKTSAHAQAQEDDEEFKCQIVNKNMAI